MQPHTDNTAEALLLAAQRIISWVKAQSLMLARWKYEEERSRHRIATQKALAEASEAIEALRQHLETDETTTTPTLAARNLYATWLDARASYQLWKNTPATEAHKAQKMAHRNSLKKRETILLNQALAASKIVNQWLATV